MPFSPSDISGLKIWLKADVGAGSSDLDPVGTWTDQSGTSHSFTQATGGKKPLYRTNVRNGLPVVRFDASQSHEMVGGNLTSVFTSAGTVVYAGNQTSGTNYTPYETSSIDSWWSFGGQGWWGPFRTSRLSSTPSSGLPTSGWHVWSCTANNGTTYKMWLDGVNKINDTGGFTFTGGTAHVLGHQTNNNTYMNMDMGELVVYDSVLSDFDRGQVETYLNDRWIAASATTSPAVVVGIGGVPAPTAQGAAVALPAVVVGSGAVPAADAHGPLPTAFPSAVVGVGAVPAPTGKGNSTSLPAATVGVGAVPAPTAKGTSTALPSAVAGVGAVPAPSAFSVATAHPARVTGTGAVPAPTVIGGFSAIAGPSVVAGIGRVPFATALGEGTGGGGGSPDGAEDFWSISLAS